MCIRDRSNVDWFRGALRHLPQWQALHDRCRAARPRLDGLRRLRDESPSGLVTCGVVTWTCNTHVTSDEQMLELDSNITPSSLSSELDRLWPLAGEKILSIESTCSPENGAPVFTVDGKYTARGWTEWTQGFQFGAAILQFDATDDEQFLEIGRRNTTKYMASHVSHIGVHDHGSVSYTHLTLPTICSV